MNIWTDRDHWMHKNSNSLIHRKIIEWFEHWSACFDRVTCYRSNSSQFYEILVKVCTWLLFLCRIQWQCSRQGILYRLNWTRFCKSNEFHTKLTKSTNIRLILIYIHSLWRSSKQLCSNLTIISDHFSSAW